MIHLLAVSVPLKVPSARLRHSTANQTRTGPLGNHPPQLNHCAIVSRLNRHLLQMGFPISLTGPETPGIPSYETPWSTDQYDAAHPFSLLPSARSLPPVHPERHGGQPWQTTVGTPAATQ